MDASKLTEQIAGLPHVFPKNFHDFSMTSKDHFPWPPDVTQQCTIFYFYLITNIRKIKFYQLQAIHPINYITLTKWIAY